MRVTWTLAALLMAGVVAPHVFAARAAPAAPVPPSAHATPAQLRPFTAEDLVRVKRVTDPQVSPDGSLRRLRAA